MAPILSAKQFFSQSGRKHDTIFFIRAKLYDKNSDSGGQKRAKNVWHRDCQSLGNQF